MGHCKNTFTLCDFCEPDNNVIFPKNRNEYKYSF